MPEPNFYWDHSFHFECENKYKLATVNYGSEISAIAGKDNGLVQFHPEKVKQMALNYLDHFLIILI